MLTGRAGSSSSARRATQPIQALNPYNNGWTIKARVANKGQMRTFANKGGAGGTTSLFTVELVDEQACSTCLPVPLMHAGLLIQHVDSCIQRVHVAPLRRAKQ